MLAFPFYWQDVPSFARNVKIMHVLLSCQFLFLGVNEVSLIIFYPYSFYFVLRCFWSFQKPFHLIAEKDVCTNLEGAKIGNIIFLLVILLLAITFTIFCVCYYYCCLIREEELEKMFKPDSNVVKFYPKLQRQPSEDNYEYEEELQYDSLPKKPKKSPSFGDRSSMRSSFNSRDGSFNRPNYQPGCFYKFYYIMQIKSILAKCIITT